MENLTLSAFRALRSLFIPGMFGVFVRSVLTTIAALIGFIFITGAFCTLAAAHLHGEIATVLPWLGSVGSAVLAWFLFPGIMPVIVNFFAGRIADIIERRDYPDAPAPTPSFWPEMLHDARFSALTILLNILVLPLYLFPILIPFIFYGLNGYLLGREFFVMIARRHCPAHDAEALRKRYAKTVLLAGVALTVMATIPIVNLFAPFWGIAVMVHLYHRLAKC